MVSAGGGQYIVQSVILQPWGPPSVVTTAFISLLAISSKLLVHVDIIERRFHYPPNLGNSVVRQNTIRSPEIWVELMGELAVRNYLTVAVGAVGWGWCLGRNVELGENFPLWFVTHNDCAASNTSCYSSRYSNFFDAGSVLDQIGPLPNIGGYSFTLRRRCMFVEYMVPSHPMDHLVLKRAPKWPLIPPRVPARPGTDNSTLCWGFSYEKRTNTKCSYLIRSSTMRRCVRCAASPRLFATTGIGSKLAAMSSSKSTTSCTTKISRK